MLLVFSGVFTFLVDAYPLYAASALAANSFARSSFAAAFPLFGVQSESRLFSYAGRQLCDALAHQKSSVYYKLEFHWATTLLAFLTVAMAPFPSVRFQFDF